MLAYGTLFGNYQTNPEGDVIAITDTDSNVVGRYRYDAWGACTIVQDSASHIANINPFRYRGYYYDTETGMYYLQSRYYDPETGRFVNADEAIVTLALGRITARSMFSYCNNNVVMLIDDSGFAPKGSEIPPASSGYVPPKGGAKKGKTKDGKVGWLDKSGNVWVPDPSNHGGDHWDVTGKNGYINVGRNGHTWGGKGKVTLPTASKSQIEWGKVVGGVFVAIIIFAVVFLVRKFIFFSGGAAIAFA